MRVRLLRERLSRDAESDVCSGPARDIERGGGGGGGGDGSGYRRLLFTHKIHGQGQPLFL